VRTNEPTAVGANDVDLMPGQQVGEYVIETKLGEGGFGTVFKAGHPLIGKLVAIKVLNRQYSAQPEMVSRFVAEARAVNQIRDRYIIDIFGFGQLEDGRHYYVMEFLDGLPLDDYIARAGRVELAAAIPILRAVARALDAAHAKGIAHRDLKPENIFLVAEPDGTLFPKLLDFGIAKLLTADDQLKHKTRTGAPIGTPFYMSPEQCRGRDVDHRTDVYAFGCVTYKLLTGVVPFDGEDYMTILMKQIGDPVPPASALVPGLPASVDQVIAWMMAKDPAQRPPSVVAAVRALEDAAAAAGIVVPSMTAAMNAVGGSGVVNVPRTGLTPVSGVAGAATMNAPGRSLAAATPVPPPSPPAAPRRRVWTFVAAIGATAVAGVVAFVAIKNRGGAEPEAEKPATVATAAPPPARPDPTPAPPGEPGRITLQQGATPTIPTTIELTISNLPAQTEVIDPEGNPLGTATGGDVVMTIPGSAQPLKLALHHPTLGDAYVDLVPDRNQKMAAPPLVPQPAPEQQTDRPRKRRSKD
jgi:eukaryotic-like serine/threonine-protein kinase